MAGTDPTRPRSDRELPFKRKPMVRWLSPAGLVNTGLDVGLSGIFGRYADKRELQAALYTDDVSDYSAHREFWIDYVADTGDGFNSTYTIASLVAAGQLDLELGGEQHETRHGQLLVLGGDQVYPTASEVVYRDRFLGPFKAALPSSPEEAPRHAFVIPGNHDWYDGLTSFLRVFCQRNWIGGWRTRQARSYFAVKLPQRWWLWGIDIQFDRYIDAPQLDYFRTLTAQKLQAGDSVILCTAKPSWVREGLEGDDIYKNPQVRRNLEYFEEQILAPHGVDAVVTLAGDLHHYAHYATKPEGATRRRHKITSGGGGAFLYPTHTLPTTVEWPTYGPGGEAAPTSYERTAVFPDVGTSRRLRWRALWAPFANLSFIVLLGAVYGVLAWTAQFSLGGGSVQAALTQASVWDLAAALGRNPAGLLLAVLVLLGLVAFADADRTVPRLALGLVHGAAHLVFALALTRGLAAALAGLSPFWFVPVFVALLVLLGALVAGLAMGLYLLVAHVVFGRHANEAFSAQHNPDYKSFVRMRIDGNGGLTLFPVGVERVPRKWALRPDASPDSPWFEPVDDAIRPQLLEEPIAVAPQGRPPDG